MQLFHQGKRLGALSRYGYETPWASAWLVLADPALLSRYATIAAFFAWSEALPDDLPDAEADARYNQELTARGLTEEDLDSWWRDWQVQGTDGVLHEVSLYQFETDGYVVWRW
jgi:hypothetical protein